MQLIEHIEILLSEYPCLSVPGFGGFVVQEVDAQFVGDDLFPPSMEVTFNRDLSHNDGLLVTQIARIKEFGTAEAASWIKEEVQRYHRCLLDFNRLELGRLGHLSVNEEGGIVFTYNKENHLFPKYFGMRPVSLSPLRKKAHNQETATTSKEEQHSAVVLKFPEVKKSYLKYIAISAAAILLFFFSTPSLFDSRKPQTASIFFDSFKFVTDTSGRLIESINPEDKEEAETNVAPVEESKQTKADIEFTENGRFCVVVMSCPSLESAKMEISKRRSLLDTAKITEGNGRFRVVVMQTDNRSKANECLNYYKSKGLTDTWLYVSR